MNNDKCEYCIHWMYQRKHKDHKTGRCLRYPPVADGEGNWENPVVWNDHRCGEFKDN